jgi:hypothetical protein
MRYYCGNGTDKRVTTSVMKLQTRYFIKVELNNALLYISSVTNKRVTLLTFLWYTDGHHKPKTLIFPHVQ